MGLASSGLGVAWKDDYFETTVELFGKVWKLDNSNRLKTVNNFPPTQDCNHAYNNGVHKFWDNGNVVFVFSYINVTEGYQFGGMAGSPETSFNQAIAGKPVCVYDLKFNPASLAKEALMNKSLEAIKPSGICDILGIEDISFLDAGYDYNFVSNKCFAVSGNRLVIWSNVTGKVLVYIPEIYDTQRKDDVKLGTAVKFSSFAEAIYSMDNRFVALTVHDLGNSHCFSSTGCFAYPRVLLDYSKGENMFL